MAEAFQYNPYAQPAVVARAVFRVMTRRLSAGEVRDVIGVLPEDVYHLWA